MTPATPLQRALMSRAAILFFLGLLTGIWVGVVFTSGRAFGLDLNLHPKFERLVLGAHLNALLGTFWLLAIAFTVEHTNFTDPGKQRLATLTTIAAYANWAVTLLASIIDARGLDIGGDGKNMLIAVLLRLFVVIPSLGASGMWIYGLRGKVIEGK